MCYGRRMTVAAGLLALLGLGAAGGCARELSASEGVSIKRAYHGHCSWYTDAQGRFRREGHTIADIVQLDSRGLYVISSVDISERYDFVISADRADKAQQVLQEALVATFGLSIERAVREMPAMVLVRSASRQMTLKASAGEGHPRLRTSPVRMCRHGILDVLADAFGSQEPTRHTFEHYAMSDLAHWLSGELKRILENYVRYLLEREIKSASWLDVLGTQLGESALR